MIALHDLPPVTTRTEDVLAGVLRGRAIVVFGVCTWCPAFSRTYSALFGRATGLGTPAAAGSGVKSSPGLMKRSRSKWYCLS